MRCFLLIVVSVWWPFLTVSYSQDPAYFVIGESELGNAHVYGISSKEDGEVFVTTDQGLYRYQHNKFVLIPGPEEQIGSSLFCPQFNRGTLYCCNLRGQIFKLQSDSLELHYTVPPDQILRNFSFFFDRAGDLVYACKQIVRVDSLGEEEQIARSESEFSFAKVFADGKVWVSNYYDSLAYEFGNDGFQSVENYPPWDQFRQVAKSDWSKFDMGNHQYWVSTGGKVLNEQGKEWQVSDPNDLYSIHGWDEQGLLLRSNKKGIGLLSFRSGIPEFRPIFDDLFISTACYSPSGALYLGTFNQGVIVVPNLQTNSTNLPQTDLVGIASSPSNEVYLASINGNVFKSENGNVFLYDSTGLHIESIEYLKSNHSWVPNKDGHLVYPNPLLNWDAKTVDEVEGGVVFNQAVGYGMFIDTSEVANWEFTPLFSEPQYFGNKVILRMEGDKRLISVGYNLPSSTLYYSNYTHTFYREKTNPTVDTLWYRGKPFMSSYIRTSGDHVICGTDKYGLLFFKDNNLLFVLDEQNGLSSNQVKKLVVSGDWVIVHHARGVQLFNHKSGTLFEVGKEEGLIERAILDLAASDDRLWLLHRGKMSSVPLAAISKEADAPTVSISGVYVNNQFADPAEKAQFEYWQNRVQILLSFPNILKQDESQLMYRLSGADTTWLSIDADVPEVIFPALSPGKYTFEIKPAYRNKEGETKRFQFSIDSPFWQKWWFYLLIVLIVALMVAVFYKRRLIRQTQKAAIDNELSMAKLTAIQSQMNPHFIFNSLNSIQYLVLKGESDRSYDYLTRFANLVRRTLDYSEKERIPLADELKLIEVYLKLEKLRFQEDFNYEVVYDLKEIKGIYIPPMLVQPFIENALVHGLLHHKGMKRLRIAFHVGETLTCTVEDNGVGRDRAKAIRERQRGDHRSFALEAIKRRFELLNKLYDGPLGYEYEDIKDDSSVSTRVTLKIPIDFRQEK